ncbi:GNAT family N-acetyltransferase [Kribbella sp. NPDC051718]|uniref:GNAT family N-acetyltransferase n=1 Tax=Kribbella sp. NPDC051718 TaxID=3155168 RepID=UPI00342CFDA7
MTELSAGLTVRPPQLRDADAIHRLAVGYFQRILGRPMVTLSEITESLTAPTITLERDGWLVLDEGGQAVGFGFVLLGGDRRFVQASVVSDDPAVSAWLLANCTERAQELGGENGYSEVTVEVGMFRADDALREVVSRQGFEFATSYQQMRIDHAGPLPLPDPPTGTTIRTGAHNDQTRRAFHTMMSTAFAGQDSAALPPYDEWLETHEKRTGFDWSQLTMVERDGRIIAASDCNHAFVETDDCGYIGRLGVLPEARGLGLAKYLLRRAFAEDANAGLAGTLLHVDTSNPTPALGLYESVGMRTVEIADGWQRTLATK